MANAEHLKHLTQGIENWNKWRAKNPEINIDLSEAQLSQANLGLVDFNEADLLEANLSESDLNNADLSNADLRGADLRKSNLQGANLQGALLNYAKLCSADIREANLHGADLSQADLSNADLWGADLSEANLNGADFSETDLSEADLSNTDLREADLSRAYLDFTNLSGSDLTNANLFCSTLTNTIVDKAKISGNRIYGVNIWDLEGEFSEKKDLIITLDDEPIITVDNIKVAQFIYLILNNKEIRDVIDTLTSKAVLILGRFSPERKAVLDAVRNKLRENNFLPIMFDFDRPTDKNITETVKTLAGISSFIIADITSPQSSPLELQAIVPYYQIPVVPIIQGNELPFSMMEDLKIYHWMLDAVVYNSLDELISILKEMIIDPAIKKHDELRLYKEGKGSR